MNYRYAGLLIALIELSLATRGLATAQAAGKVRCVVSENGAVASGTMVVSRDGKDVATGPCGDPLSVTPGSYTVVVRLDGALDKPQKTQRALVKENATTQVTADFATAIVEVKIQSNGARAAGMATITRDGKTVGTLGSGVAAHISAGTYDIVARYRTQERKFPGVVLAAKQRRSLEASFDTDKSP